MWFIITLFEAFIASLVAWAYVPEPSWKWFWLFLALMAFNFAGFVEGGMRALWRL